MVRRIVLIMFAFSFSTFSLAQVKWEHILSKTGALEAPNRSNQQTSATVADFDLDGDGDLDTLGKPYDGDAPRLDIWLQNGTGTK